MCQGFQPVKAAKTQPFKGKKKTGITPGLMVNGKWSLFF
jgi:hypothetical protein